MVFGKYFKTATDRKSERERKKKIANARKREIKRYCLRQKRLSIRD